MLTENDAALLEKAVKRSHAYHHKKAADHNTGKAEDHQKAADAHKAQSEHYEKVMEKAKADKNDDAAEVAKSSMSFHKTQYKHHESQVKRHTNHALHHQKMSKAFEESDAKKMLKLLELPDEPTTEVVAKTATSGEQTVSTTTTPATATTAATEVTKPGNEQPTKTEPTAAAAAAVDQGIGAHIEKALNDRVSKAIDEGFERVMKSPEFQKQLEDRLSAKMLEKLGGQPAHTEVKTFAVPRTEAEAAAAVAKASGASTVIGQVSPSGAKEVDPQFAHLCVIEDRA